MAGMKVVPVKALGDGSLDLQDLADKAKLYKDRLAAFMVRTNRPYIPDLTMTLICPPLQITYPSTFGVFEDGVQEVRRLADAMSGSDRSKIRPAASFTTTGVKSIWMVCVSLTYVSF